MLFLLFLLSFCDPLLDIEPPDFILSIYYLYSHMLYLFAYFHFILRNTLDSIFFIPPFLIYLISKYSELFLDSSLTCYVMCAISSWNFYSIYNCVCMFGATSHSFIFSMVSNFTCLLWLSFVPLDFFKSYSISCCQFIFRNKGTGFLLFIYFLNLF